MISFSWMERIRESALENHEQILHDHTSSIHKNFHLRIHQNA
uniref:Uncharacterized protein n=1 Tax=Lepeophtheirus salmonis TaxID=72036 RepID=A0A0K2UUR2_LEPSM